MDSPSSESETRRSLFNHTYRSTRCRCVFFLTFIDILAHIFPGDVIWLAAGDVCAFEAHVLTEGAVVKSLKGSRIASEIFLAGDRVESGCGEALVVQPARSSSSVLKVKVEQLLMVQPAQHVGHAKSTSDLREAPMKSNQQLRKSGNIPSTLKIERPPSVAVSDARRAAALSTMACIIVGMRGIITLDRTIVGTQRYSCKIR